jgi:hypothetical protein
MTKGLNNPTRVLLLGAIFGLLLPGCEPTIKVRSDSSPGVNLAQYSTYDFFSTLGVEQEGHRGILGEHFRNAVSAQLNSRGFSLSASPQLQVNVTVSKDEKIRVNTYQDPYLYGGYYGGVRRGAYWGAPMYYGGGTQTTVSQYTQAYVYIDLVDAQQHKLVWQGAATFVLTEKMQEQVRDAVNRTVAEIFTQFPVTAEQAK